MKVDGLRMGNNDLWAGVDSSGGFFHVVLGDADDGDVIVVDEDDLQYLVDFLLVVISQRDE